MDISQFGKGAVKTPKEIRDLHPRLSATPALVDWSQPFYVHSTVPVLNQNGSSSCTAHATVNYCMFLESVEGKAYQEFSRRFIYSQTHLREGGAYIGDAMAIPQNKGLATENSVPDGGATEQQETDTSQNASAILIARADRYAVIPKSGIDQLAQVIKDYNGFVTGFQGHDGMFDASGQIIDWSRNDWGHAVYVYGYEMRAGVKCLRFRNSWSGNWGSGGDGFIPEGFVNSGVMFDCYTYADVSDITQKVMTQDQLNKLYLGFFKRPVDQGGINQWVGKDFDTVVDGLLASPENREYTPIFEAVKKLENDVRSGQF